MAANTIYNLENNIKYLKKKSKSLKKNNKRLSKDNIENETLLISSSTWNNSDPRSAVSEPSTDSTLSAVSEPFIDSPLSAVSEPLTDSPGPATRLSSSSSSTVSISAGSSKSDFCLPQVPEWSITEKMENYFSSKQKSKAKKRSLQSKFIKKSKIEKTERNLKSEDLEPKYIRSHSNLESIFFILGFFLLSSVLTTGITHFTFILTLSIQILLGFYDPAFLNSLIISIGNVLNLGITLIGILPTLNFIYPSWVPRVRNRPKKLILNKLECLNKYLFPRFYFKRSLLNNSYLRNAKIHLIENNSRLNKSLRLHVFRKSKRLTSEYLQIKKVSQVREDENRIPFSIFNSVPLAYPELGNDKISLILDTGSPVSILPLHLLTTFEKDNKFICTRFLHNKLFAGHGNATLDILHYGVELPLIFTLKTGEKQPIILPFYIERTTSKQGILGISAINKIELYTGLENEENFFHISKVTEPVIPTSPIALNETPEGKLIQGICLQDGNYSLETRSYQTFHEPGCMLAHDPRIECLSEYNDFFELFDVARPTNPLNIQGGEPCLVKIVNNKILMCELPNMYQDNFGTLEWHSEVEQGPDRKAIHRPNGSILHPELRQPEDINDDLIFKVTSVYNEKCTRNNIENINLTDEILEQSMKTYEFIETKFENIIEHKKETIANIFFVDFNFKCFCKNIACPCPLISKNQSTKIKNSQMNKMSLFLIHKPDNSVNYVIRIPGFQNIQDSPIGVFLSKSIFEKKIETLVFNSTNSALCENLLKSLSTTLLSQTFQLKFCFNTLYCNQVNVKPINDQIKSNNKHEKYAASKNTISDSILEEPEAFPPLDVTSLKQDTESFLKRSCPKESEFLTLLTETYVDAISLGPADIGKIKGEKYKMDIVLENENCKLPLDIPFPTNNTNKIACTRVIDSWLKAKIVEKSNVRTHGARLTVAKKHLSESDFLSIKNRLNLENNIVINERAELFKQNPLIFTDAEISKLFRICLDARRLNSLTKAEFTCSPNPESVIVELISLGSEGQCSLSNSESENENPKLNKYLNKDENDTEDDILYFSSLDIKSAHSSLVLTDQASYYLNAILPDFTTIRFLRSPFGLKCVNSKFNFVLSDILSSLIKKRLVILYADDVLLINRGRVQHRLLLKEVFRLFAIHGLKVSLNKCSCFVSKFTFLGFDFDKSGITLTSERIKTILGLPRPTNLKSLQRFIGAFSYISKFLPDAQQHLLCITKLLNKNNPFLWGEPQEKAFSNLKNLVNSNMCLSYIDTKFPLLLYCDASQYAGGGVLYQELPPDNIKKPIAFFSRKFNPTQSRLYSSLELELINVIDCLGRVSCFINQSPFPLKIVTDAKNILFLIKSQVIGKNPKLCRLASRLANYDVVYQLIYEKPLNNAEFLIADYISRAYDPDNFESIPMAALRKVNKKDITHDLPEGKNYSYSELTQLVQSNPKWFKNFPIPVVPDKEDVPLLTSLEIQEARVEGERSGNQPTEPTFNTVNHIFNNFQDLTPLKLLGAQRDDSDLIKIILNLENNFKDETNDENGYFMSKRILHKLKNISLKISPENSVLVLPNKIIPDTIGYFHIVYGHLGVERLSKIIGTLYFAKQLMSKVKLLVLGCATCQLAKGATNRLPPISPSKPPLYPMQILSLDYFSTPPSHGNHFILIAICRFSGFLFARKCKKEGSVEVIGLLKQIFSQVGPPISITSDNGSTLLRNKEVQKFLAGWGVHNISLSLAYSPLHNARAERSVKYFRSLMRCFTMNKEKSWANYFERLLFIYNSTPRVFKLDKQFKLISPFQIFLRRPARPLFINSSLIKDPTGREHFMLEKENIEALDTHIKDFQFRQTKHYHENHNLTSRTPNFSAGDLVLLKNMRPPQQGEMPLKYLSPYKHVLFIVKHVSEGFTVLLNPLDGSIKYMHSRFIKKYRARGPIFEELNKELKDIMGDNFDPHNYGSRNKLVELMSKIKQTYSPHNSDQESLHDSEDLSDSDSVIAQPALLNKKNSVTLRDEFFSSDDSSFALHEDQSSKNIPVNNQAKISDKLDKIKPANSIIKSLRNLPSRIARTIRNNK